MIEREISALDSPGQRVMKALRLARGISVGDWQKSWDVLLALNFLEKNVLTFMDIQKRMQSQSSQLHGANPMLNTEAWNEFVKMQGPAIQGLMGRYLEQSANAFVEMQQQMQNQTRNMFGGFPFPGFGGAPGAGVPPGKDGGSENKS